MQALIDFIIANQMIVVGAIVAILDFIFALTNLEANGLIHSVYVFFKNMLEKK